MIAEHAIEESTRYAVNEAFNRAVLSFRDGSDLTFEHTSRDNRWAKASLAGSIADGICLSLRQFRLNAKHLQLFFEDGSDVEFFADVTEWKCWHGQRETTFHRSRADLEAGLVSLRDSPKDEGVLLCIVRRPQKHKREILNEGFLNVEEGLSGDNWMYRHGSKTDEGTPYPETQITIMNSRAIQLIAVEQDRWPLAGDQLYVEIDLSAENLPPGMRLVLGEAVIQVSADPHTGCRQFVDRFGMDAMKFVNSPAGRELNLRGIYAKVVQPGIIRVGDRVRKVKAE